jgi:hypothetical protein
MSQGLSLLEEPGMSGIHEQHRCRRLAQKLHRERAGSRAAGVVPLRASGKVHTDEDVFDSVDLL